MGRGVRFWWVTCGITTYARVQSIPWRWWTSWWKVDIEQELSVLGPIADVWVARNPPVFAFIVFKYAEDADRAVRRMDGSRPFGSRLRVEHAVNNKTANSRRHDRSRSRSYSKRRRDSPPRRRTPVRRSSSGRRSDFRDTRRHSPPGYERNRSGHEDRYRTRSHSSSKRSSKHKASRARSRTPSRQSSHRNSNRHSRSQSRNSHKNNGRHSPYSGSSLGFGLMIGLILTHQDVERRPLVTKIRVAS
uniref:Alternative splicing factor SRp20/9G8-like protein n=1 Tax=Schistosoma mansoni TaxID=6183 RepID=Q15ET7_SCHMA|nr:alternative splicing factor SRp20/9G8-like protein [Schistosoma mansoni]